MSILFIHTSSAFQWNVYSIHSYFISSQSNVYSIDSYVISNGMSILFIYTSSVSLVDTDDV